MIFAANAFILFSLIVCFFECFNYNCPSFQMFSDYQMQEMSENFIDSFGFQDDEFADSDINSRLINN